MNIKKHIPNFLTCCNLLCGIFGILIVKEIDFQLLEKLNYIPEGVNIIDPLRYAAFCIFMGCIFDFLDGFAARMLKVSSPIGKELDSLADVITFGVLPAFIVQKLFTTTISLKLVQGDPDGINLIALLSLLSFLIPVFSALRLAKFNIDTRQTNSFIGLPTPANSILIASLPLILNIKFPQNEALNIFTPKIEMDFISEIILNPFLLGSLSIILSFLLVAELPLFALKFKNFSWADNKMKYILLASSVVLLILLQWAAIPLIIFLYILLSVIEHKLLKAKS